MGKGEKKKTRRGKRTRIKSERECKRTGDYRGREDQKVKIHAVKYRRKCKGREEGREKKTNSVNRIA